MVDPMFAMEISDRALLIPIFGILGVFLFLPGMVVLLGYILGRHRHEERLRMIEKGMPIPVRPYDPMRAARCIRLAGLILVAIGIGIALTGLGRPAVREPMSIEVPGGPSIYTRGGVRRGGPAPAAGAIPFMIGAGLLLDYRFRIKELKNREKASDGATTIPPAGRPGE